jgi:hypothetical protein
MRNEDVVEGEDECNRDNVKTRQERARCLVLDQR